MRLAIHFSEHCTPRTSRHLCTLVITRHARNSVHIACGSTHWIPLPSYQAIACLFSSEVTGIVQNSSGKGIPYKGYDSAANRHACAAYGYRDRIFRRRMSNGRRTHAKRGVVEPFFLMGGQASEAHPNGTNGTSIHTHGNDIPGLRVLARRTHAGCFLKKRIKMGARVNSVRRYRR